MGDLGQGACPDGGACHHDCAESCWRVSTCLPLSGSGWDDWPEPIKVMNPPVERLENLLIEPPSRGRSDV